MEDDTRRSKIRNYIKGCLDKKGDRNDFDDKELLITGGRLDSLDAVGIVIFLEEQFGIDFSSIGLDMNVIDSVDAVEKLLSK